MLATEGSGPSVHGRLRSKSASREEIIASCGTQITRYSKIRRILTLFDLKQDSVRDVFAPNSDS
jgi:hypothetical protein